MSDRHTDTQCDLKPGCNAVLTYRQDACNKCKLPYPPNVRAAKNCKQGLEAAARRVHQDVLTGSDPNASQKLNHLDNLMGNASVAIHMNYDVLRLMLEGQGYKSYYQLVEQDLMPPRNAQDASDRGAADEHMFPGYGEHIRYGAVVPSAISVDDAKEKFAIGHYGPLAVHVDKATLNTQTSLFVRDSLRYYQQRHREGAASPCQYQDEHFATWADVKKLALIKCKDQLTLSLTINDIQALILSEGSPEDRIIEAHIYAKGDINKIGPNTIETVVYSQKAVQQLENDDADQWRDWQKCVDLAGPQQDNFPAGSTRLVEGV